MNFETWAARQGYDHCLAKRVDGKSWEGVRGTYESGLVDLAYRAWCAAIDSGRCDDPTIEAVVDRLRARSRKGLSEYGCTLADSLMGESEALQHAQDEALDLANYLEVMKARRRAAGGE